MSEHRNASSARLDEAFEGDSETSSLPRHERILLIARVAVRDPAKLTEDEIKDLANAMIMHYAQMGIG